MSKLWGKTGGSKMKNYYEVEVAVITRQEDGNTNYDTTWVQRWGGHKLREAVRRSLIEVGETTDGSVFWTGKARIK